MPATEDTKSQSDREASDRIARGALWVTLGILASRFFGLIRQAALALFLGTSEAADAVAAAFRVGNISQNLLGEGTLSASFIPIYSRLKEQNPETAGRFARATLGILLLVVVFVSAAGVLCAAPLATLLAPGFSGHKRQLTIQLLHVIFPMTGLLVLCAWALGVLNSHRRFFLPYAAPVVWNVAQIIALWLAARSFPENYEAIAKGVVWGAAAGAALQLMLLLPGAQRLLSPRGISFDYKVEGIRDAASRLPATIVGRGVIQISGLIDTLLVSMLGTGANATHNYAQTIFLLPMSLLGTGEASASLPEIAQRSASSGIANVLEGTMKRVLLLGLAAALIMGMLSTELVTVLLQRGQFDANSTRVVAQAVAIYALALPANAVARVLSTTCFALGETTRPARYAAIRVGVSTVISVALMVRFGVPGVIAGAVVAAYVELSLLFRCVLGFAGSPLPRLRTLALIVPVAAAGPALAVLAGSFMSASFAASWWGSTCKLAIATTTFVFGALASKVLRLPKIGRPSP